VVIVTKPVAILLMGLVILTGAACGSADGDDSAGQDACARFREVAAGAYGESMSESEVVSGLEEVGSIAEDSTTPAIRDNAAKVAEEANAQSMISGEPNGPQDAFADACNDAYPI
jgi:hypothetical protein